MANDYFWLSMLQAAPSDWQSAGASAKLNTEHNVLHSQLAWHASDCHLFRADPTMRPLFKYRLNSLETSTVLGRLLHSLLSTHAWLCFTATYNTVHNSSRQQPQQAFAHVPHNEIGVMSDASSSLKEVIVTICPSQGVGTQGEKGGRPDQWRQQPEAHPQR